MKKAISLFITILTGFCFVANVNAEEISLSTIASIPSDIGGADKEIIQTDSSNTYKFYYKYIAIDSEDFNSYIDSKYIVDNSSDTSSEEYLTAQSQVEEYETTFKGLIPSVTVADLESWTLSSDGEINISDLVYQSGSHNGYVLAIAAVKDGDTSNVYIDRLILESKSQTTLGQISYPEKTSSNVNSNDTVATDENPNTGLSDYAIYLVPISIILGSTILLRRNYA